MTQLVIRAGVGVAVVLAASTSALGASQDRLMIDPEGGRRVVGGFEFAFRALGGNAIDRERGWLYDRESADRHRVQALSLEDGQLLRTYGAGEGDGPGELREINAIAAAPDGLVGVSRNRVSRWDTNGRFLGSWRPGGTVSDVCMIGDSPAIPVPGGIGVAYRTSDGATATIPPGIPPAGRPRPSSGHSAFDLEIACDSDLAYVASENRITGYPIRGDPFDVPIPTSVAEDAAEAHSRATGGQYFYWYRSMSLDQHGRIVLVSTFRAEGPEGVLIEPSTGCHTFIVDEAPGHGRRQLMGVYRDSALMAEWGTRMVEYEGQMVEATTVGSAIGIWLMPLVADPESAARRAEAGCGEAG